MAVVPVSSDIAYLACLVLRHLVLRVLPTVFSLAVRPPRLRYVNLASKLDV